MKFLADMGLSPVTVTYLRELGHELVRLPEVGLDRRSDSEVIDYALIHGQVVLTFDLDFPALLALNPSHRASAIIFRTRTAKPKWINERLSEILPPLEDVLKDGAIVVVEDHRIRVRRFLDL